MTVDSRGPAPVRPLRIAHLTTVDMSLALLLGTELAVDVEAGHEVFGISASGPYVERVEALGVTHVPVRALTRSWAPTSDLAAFRELFTTIRSLDLDVLHTHNPKTGVMGRIAGRLAGVPVRGQHLPRLVGPPRGPPGQARLRLRAGGAGRPLLRLRAVPERRRPRHPAARPQAWPAPSGGQRGRPRAVRTRPGGPHAGAGRARSGRRRAARRHHRAPGSREGPGRVRRGRRRAGRQGDFRLGRPGRRHGCRGACPPRRCHPLPGRTNRHARGLFGARRLRSRVVPRGFLARVDGSRGLRHGDGAHRHPRVPRGG